MKPTKLSFTGYRKYRLNVLQTKASSDPRLDPPCSGCTACCSHYKSININAHELGQEWLLADTPDEQGNAHLRHKADGSCIYLGEHGCSIYDRRPETCRIFDCRDFAMTGIQPRGELGRASVDMAEQTLGAKRNEDWILLAAMRMAAFQFVASNHNHTAEECSAVALYCADAFIDQVKRLDTIMDDVKRTKPNEWRSLCELLQGATPQDWQNLMDNMVKHG